MKPVGICYFLLTLILPVRLLAQSFPVESGSGKIFYSEEVLVKDADQVDLYKRAHKWLLGLNKNKTLKKADQLNGVLQADGFLLYGDKPANLGSAGDTLHFSIIVKVDDDRYWYRFADFYLQKKNQKIPKPDLNLYPLESLVKTLTRHKQIESPNLNNYKLQHKLAGQVEALIESFKKSML